jgi:hypothetical protein
MDGAFIHETGGRDLEPLAEEKEPPDSGGHWGPYNDEYTDDDAEYDDADGASY